MNTKKIYTFIFIAISFVLLFKISSTYIFVTYIKEPEKNYSTFGFLNDKQIDGKAVKKPKGDGYEFRSSANFKAGSGGKSQENTNKTLPETFLNNTKNFASKTKFGWIPLIILVILGSVYWYRKNKLRKKKQMQVAFQKDLHKNSVDFFEEEKTSGQQSLPTKKYFDSELRKMIQVFNSSLNPKQKRKNYETVSEWFTRINFMPTSHLIYNEHRYGEKDLIQLNEEEMKVLENEMKSFLGGGSHADSRTY